MATISICMIVKNEEKLLESALNTIYKVADEIIITDTGSTDKTVEIAKKFTDKIYHFQWIDDLSAARNFCQQYATKDYILKWDADWFLRPESLNKLIQLKPEFAADLISFTWNLEFNEKNLPLTSQAYHFLFKNNLFKWEMPEHERLVLVENNTKNQLTKQYFPEIQVDHFKDVSKKSRYIQTRKLLEKVFVKNENDLLSVVYYAQGCLFEKDYTAALKYFYKALELYPKQPVYDLDHIVEKTIFCLINLKEYAQAELLSEKYGQTLQENLRFKLIYTDLISVQNPVKSIELYEEYLTHSIPDNLKLLDYSDERYIIHPHLMLGRLYFSLKKFRSAYGHFKIVADKSLVQDKIDKIKVPYCISSILRFFA